MFAEHPSELSADYSNDADDADDAPPSFAQEAYESSSNIHVIDPGQVIWHDRAFRATFEQAAVGMSCLAPDGRWLVVNQRLCDIVGYTREELLQRTFQDITYPDDLAADLAQAKRLVDGEIETYSMEKRYIRKDGTLIWINLTAAVVRTPEGAVDYFISVVEDIDARKRLEQERDELLARERAAREQAEERLLQLQRLLLVSDVSLSSLPYDELAGALLERVRALMAVDNAAILLLDEDTQVLNVLAARGLEEAVATTVHVSVGEGLSGRIAATRMPLIVDDLSTFPIVSNIMRDELASVIGVPLILGSRLLGVLHVGSVAPRRFTGEDAYLLQLVADRVAHAVDNAQARAAAEQARMDAERRARELEAVFETVSDRLIVYDSVGRIVRLNRSARESLPIDGASEYGEQPVESRINNTYALRMLDGQPLPVEAWPIWRLLRGEVLKDAQAQQILMRDRNGRDVCMSVTGAPLTDADGKIIGAVGGFHDVTALLRAEERERTQRLVAHELSVPLADTAMRVHILTRLQEELPELARRQLSGMERALGRIKDLVAELRDAASLNSGIFTLSPEPCDLRMICAQVVEDCRLSSKRTILFDESGAPTIVRADPARLGQVIENLLSNALMYSPPDASVWVRVEPAGEYVRVAMRDEGVGILSEQLPYLFDEFYRVANPDGPAAPGGLGLGLYICKALIVRHGGSIGVESTPGAGSTFWFTLPLLHSNP